MGSRNHPSVRTGFTLLEVVIAMAILSIGILAFAKIFPAGRLLVGYAGQRTSAVTMAEKLLREFQQNPLLLAHAYKTSVSLSPNCFDSSSKPRDSQDLGTLANPPCGAAPNGVDEIVRVVGEGGVFDESFPGIWHLRFPPYAVVPVTVSTDPDILSPRIYADVQLSPAYALSSPSFSAGAAFYYNPGPASITLPPVVSAGQVIIPASNTGPGWAPIARYAVSQRVFRCSYQWIDTSDNVHQVVDERNKVLLAIGSDISFSLQAVNSPAGFSSIVTDPNSGATGSLIIVEEVDLSWRIFPFPASNFAPISFVTGAIAAGVPPPPVAAAAIPFGTGIKFDYSIAPDPTDGKHWRWITEPAEVQSSGVLKLSVRPLSPDHTINILRAGGGTPIAIAKGLTSRTKANLNGPCLGWLPGPPQVDLPCAPPPPPPSLPAEVYAIDYEKGEIHFDTTVISVKTPLWITYRPADDWIVQVLSAPQVYVPSYASKPSAGAPVPAIGSGDPNPPGTGYQRYREYAENLAAPLTTVIGFHKSEIGKAVSVDYIDAAGGLHVGESHTIVDPAPLPYVFTTDFPGEVFLSSPYLRLLKVNGVSVKVRVLWADKNNYREAAATGTVGVR